MFVGAVSRQLSGRANGLGQSATVDQARAELRTANDQIVAIYQAYAQMLADVRASMPAGLDRDDWEVYISQRLNEVKTLFRLLADVRDEFERKTGFSSGLNPLLFGLKGLGVVQWMALANLIGTTLKFVVLAYLGVKAIEPLTNYFDRVSYQARADLAFYQTLQKGIPAPAPRPAPPPSSMDWKTVVTFGGLGLVGLLLVSRGR